MTNTITRNLYNLLMSQPTTKEIVNDTTPEVTKTAVKYSARDADALAATLFRFVSNTDELIVRHTQKYNRTLPYAKKMLAEISLIAFDQHNTAAPVEEDSDPTPAEEERGLEPTHTPKPEQQQAGATVVIYKDGDEVERYGAESVSAALESLGDAGRRMKERGYSLIRELGFLILRADGTVARGPFGKPDHFPLELIKVKTDDPYTYVAQPEEQQAQRAGVTLRIYRERVLTDTGAFANEADARDFWRDLQDAQTRPELFAATIKGPGRTVYLGDLDSLPTDEWRAYLDELSAMTVTRMQKAR